MNPRVCRYCGASPVYWGSCMKHDYEETKDQLRQRIQDVNSWYGLAL